MREYTGWLFEIYPKKDGVVVWIVGEDKKPHSFTQPFQMTFYVSGPFHRLRQLWKFLRDKPVQLDRTKRQDLHEGMKDVMEVKVFDPLLFDELFREVNRLFPDLLYFDTDIPLILRYGAEFGVFPLGHCKVEVQQGWNISEITPLDTPWELDPELPELRILESRPDENPHHAMPRYLRVQFNRFDYKLPLNNSREL